MGASSHRTESTAFDLVGLSALMRESEGSSALALGLVDGPIAIDHPDLQHVALRLLTASQCGGVEDSACEHGTFIAGLLFARRASESPGICPSCALVVRSIFSTTGASGVSASLATLTTALRECIDAGARIVNLSLAPSSSSSRPQAEAELHSVLDFAARRGVLVIVASGNEGSVASSALTRHPWVIPVAACDSRGVPLSFSNLGRGIASRGLLAPGDVLTSLSAQGGIVRALGGTSAATALVAGAAALLWSLFPNADGPALRQALVGDSRRGITPPLLDANRAFQSLQMTAARSSSTPTKLRE